MRSLLFQQLDGFAVAPTALALEKVGILTNMSAHAWTSLADIVKACNGNEGYLNVALRILCSQGWLKQKVASNGQEVAFMLTEKGEVALPHVNLYQDIVAFIPYHIFMDDFLFHGKYGDKAHLLEEMIRQHENRWGLPPSEHPLIHTVQEEILTHIEGMLIGPIWVALGMKDFFKQFNTTQLSFSLNTFNGHKPHLLIALKLLKLINWVTEDKDNYTFTAKGLFMAKRATAYGVTVSYLPTFQKVHELLYNDPYVLWKKPEGSAETHVNRTMNVWGSGGAHSTYFGKIDEIVISIFNQPIEAQPKGFVDMGCGDGTFISHLFDVIEHQTERGKILDKHPLIIVGSDYNKAALVAASHTLSHADVWAELIFGDIGDPDRLAKDLQEKYEVDLNDLLNVRSFLDHNRIYEQPTSITVDQSSSTGAFAFRGRRIPNNELEQNLIEHFKKWAKYLEKFGLIVLELHTVKPELVASNIGKTVATAYDGTHGYSDQYIVELDVFLQATKAAGLDIIPKYQSKFPDSALATISIHLLKAHPTQ